MTAKLIVVALLVAVMISLGAGMFFLVRDRGRSQRSSKALLVRVLLSTVVLLALALAFGLGAIDPGVSS